jgi:hypothetical protein
LLRRCGRLGAARPRPELVARTTGDAATPGVGGAEVWIDPGRSRPSSAILPRAIELLSLLDAALGDALRSRQHLLLENLLLRQQLQVALRSPRRPRLRAWDKLFATFEDREGREDRAVVPLSGPQGELDPPAWRLVLRRRQRAERERRAAADRVPSRVLGEGSSDRQAGLGRSG